MTTDDHASRFSMCRRLRYEDEESVVQKAFCPARSSQAHSTPCVWVHGRKEIHGQKIDKAATTHFKSNGYTPYDESVFCVLPCKTRIRIWKRPAAGRCVGTALLAGIYSTVLRRMSKSKCGSFVSWIPAPSSLSAVSIFGQRSTQRH